MKNKLSHILLLTILLLSVNDSYAQLAKKIHVIKAGTLVTYLTENEGNEITHLTLTGNINAVDFRHLRDEFKNLTVLDISNADIRMHTGKGGTSPDNLYVYPKNCIPAYAFCKSINGKWIGKSSLKRVVFSEKIRNIEDGALKNCTNLKIIEIGKKKAPNLLSEALENTNAAIFVPLGCSDNYKMNVQWKSYAILEGSPIYADIRISESSNLGNELLNLGIQPGEVNFLTIEGKLDEVDFKLIRNYMPNLVSIDIEKTSTKVIPEFTFSQKTYLLDVKLPSQLEVIGQRAFSNCIRLNGDLILPSSMVALEYGVFLGCKALNHVIATGNKLTTIGKDIFDEGNSFKLIYQ